MHWYINVLKKYAVFDGRARRKEYWYFYLINFLIGMALGIIDKIIGLHTMSEGMGGISLIYTLAVLIPGLAVSVRRLHDIGRSGWWLLLGFVPVVGFIILFIFTLLDSKPGHNQYGPSPKAVTM